METQVRPLESLPGAIIRALMRRNHKTISSVALSMGITQSRVREVRACGVRGVAYVRDWLEALQ